jgi:hypothetical protein
MKLNKIFVLFLVELFIKFSSEFSSKNPRFNKIYQNKKVHGQVQLLDYNSIVKLEMGDNLGTGVFISPTTLITARHCIQSNMNLPISNKTLSIIEKITMYTSNEVNVQTIISKNLNNLRSELKNLSQLINNFVYTDSTKYEYMKALDIISLGIRRSINISYTLTNLINNNNTKLINSLSQTVFDIKTTKQIFKFPNNTQDIAIVEIPNLQKYIPRENIKYFKVVKKNEKNSTLKICGWGVNNKLKDEPFGCSYPFKTTFDNKGFLTERRNNSVAMPGDSGAPLLTVSYPHEIASIHHGSHGNVSIGKESFSTPVNQTYLKTFRTYIISENNTIVLVDPPRNDN